MPQVEGILTEQLKWTWAGGFQGSPCSVQSGGEAIAEGDAGQGDLGCSMRGLP